MVERVEVHIDRGSPMPLYHQLAEQLATAITDGTLQPGDPFENEMALTERLGLSRPTIRRAIQELVGQGLLVRRRGLGTRVANSRVHRKAELTSLYDDLRLVGREPHTKVLSFSVDVDEKAAAALDLPLDEKILNFVRLRYAGDDPLAVMHNWLPPRFADITEDELCSRGLYSLLRDRGIRPVVARQTIGARPPTATERRHLGLKPSQPVLTMTRCAFDAAGNPVEYGDHSYRADGYSIEVMLDER
ncbi:MAG: GntR family transcriptional regulator [Intrasporangium sp.]|uniref:GntR family transcriptional regulator n=1 Tax=Intrasporangium sp. TaxID=1925024 RepID=UPI0026486891|nr:GntR family transcriptional regulator [Intrasporangium sp.]MDN5797087.1 GntR family transcriptional regulator [Intrasporangium sp.]